MELREIFCRRCRTGLGWTGPRGPVKAGETSRDGDRAGPGRGAGDVRVPTLNVRRNRLECSFGAEYRGENPVFFTGFFPGDTSFFPR